MNEPTTRNITVLNRASVKKYALGVSAARRAGKFTRVGEEFLLRCEARLESELRSIATIVDSTPAPGLTFITKLARNKAARTYDGFAKELFGEFAQLNFPNE